MHQRCYILCTQLKSHTGTVSIYCNIAGPQLNRTETIFCCCSLSLYCVSRRIFICRSVFVFDLIFLLFGNPVKGAASKIETVTRGEVYDSFAIKIHNFISLFEYCTRNRIDFCSR